VAPPRSRSHRRRNHPQLSDSPAARVGVAEDVNSQRARRAAGQFSIASFIGSFRFRSCGVDFPPVCWKIATCGYNQIMGIDARIETERGTCAAELGDPHNRMYWLLSLATLDSTLCLRFIDPYGDALFNGLQIPILQSECSALALRLTEPNLLESKRVYLERAEVWPKAALEEARKAMETLSLCELRDHLQACSSSTVKQYSFIAPPIF